MVRFLVIVIALVVAMGGFVYGFDSGIIATTLGHETLKQYFYGPSLANSSLTGAIVSVYNAGQAIGGLTSGFVADKFSRKYAMSFMAFLSIVGAILQCAATHSAMMILGRFLAGVGCGSLLSVVPVYLAETAQADTRGFLVGLHGMMIAIGFGLANWVGYAGSFAIAQAQWRVPLAMQIPIPAAMMVGCLFIPFSPRWLVQQDRVEEAEAVILRLHGMDNFNLATQELIQIREQLNLERAQGNTSWLLALRTMFNRQYLRRTATAAFIVAMGQLSGSSVIQNFQGIFYETVGFTGKTSLLISGAYGMMGIVGQIFYLFVVADKWPRVRTLWVGSVVLSVMISICMALSAQFGDGTNQAGARGAIAMIFIYSACYAIFFNAMIWVVPSELFPFFLRSKGLAFAVFTKSTVAIVLSQITPVALANVSWRYYSLFIATNMVAAFIYFFFLPETSGKSLEEIGELFGDVLAPELGGAIELDAKKEIFAEEHVEAKTTEPGKKA